MPGIVAAGHPQTSEAAALALEAGGNAFDAAVAGLLMACVAEPLLTSLGGGGFVLAETASGERLVFDFFAQTPSRRRPNAVLFPILGDFGTATQEFHIGAGAAAVPGLVDGLFAVHRRLGSLPMDVLAEPAIAAARNGVRINRFQAFAAGVLTPILAASEPLQALFTGPNGLIAEGDLQTQPRLAATIEQLLAEGPDAFYRGEIAKRIVALCEQHGGHLIAADMAAYRTEIRPPLEVKYHGHQVITNPVPSCGGSLIALSVSLLNRLNSDDWQPGSPGFARDLARVFELTQAERMRTSFQSRPSAKLITELLAEDHLRQLVEALNGPVATRGTTHLSVADGRGNLAAATVSNGEGCGHLIPDTGIHLNNFLGEQDLSPAGVGNWTADQRMSSMMAPTIVDRADGGRIALGTGGSNRIRSAITQVLMHVLEFGCSLEQAVGAPRLHFDAGKVSIEPGWSANAYQTLDREFPELERWDRTNLFFGGVHAVEVDPERREFSAAGDPRRGGAVRRAR